MMRYLAIVSDRTVTPESSHSEIRRNTRGMGNHLFVIPSIFPLDFYVSALHSLRSPRPRLCVFRPSISSWKRSDNVVNVQSHFSKETQYHQRGMNIIPGKCTRVKAFNSAVAVKFGFFIGHAHHKSWMRLC